MTRSRSNVVALARNKSTDATRDSRHAAAFRELESDVCDLLRAADLALVAKEADDVGESGGGLTLFTIQQFAKMAEDLKKKYYELWGLGGTRHTQDAGPACACPHCDLRHR